jgi:hypothetical protein
VFLDDLDIGVGLDVLQDLRGDDQEVDAQGDVGRMQDRGAVGQSAQTVQVFVRIHRNRADDRHAPFRRLLAVIEDAGIGRKIDDGIDRVRVQQFRRGHFPGRIDQPRFVGGMPRNSEIERCSSAVDLRITHCSLVFSDPRRTVDTARPVLPKPIKPILISRFLLVCRSAAFFSDCRADGAKPAPDALGRGPGYNDFMQQKIKTLISRARYSTVKPAHVRIDPILAINEVSKYY